MRDNLTELVFILDRSGSMSGLEADPGRSASWGGSFSNYASRIASSYSSLHWCSSFCASDYPNSA